MHRAVAALLTLALASAAPAQQVTYPPVSTSGQLSQVATATVGETVLVAVALNVRRYTVSAPGTTTSDRIVLTLTGAPTNCTLQDAYVSTPGTISVGVLTAVATVGGTIACPLALYRVTP